MLRPQGQQAVGGPPGLPAAQQRRHPPALRTGAGAGAAAPLSILFSEHQNKALAWSYLAVHVQDQLLSVKLTEASPSVTADTQPEFIIKDAPSGKPTRRSNSLRSPGTLMGEGSVATAAGP